MKHLFFFTYTLLFFFFSSFQNTKAQAPPFRWAKSIGGNANDSPYSIAVDAAGNVYTVGVFETSVDFDPGPSAYNLSTSGIFDVFISKLDSAGNFIWTKRIGGTMDDYGLSIALDDSANVYTTGYFTGSVDFDPGTATHTITAPNLDFFISKLDSAGNFMWAKSFGGAAGYPGYITLAPDPSGNIYLTGSFWGTMDFNPGSGTFNLTSLVNAAMFVTKLDHSGNFLWAISTDGLENAIGSSIVVEPGGSRNVFVTGSFQDTVDFDPGPGTVNLISNGFSDVFFLKLDSAGNLKWVKTIGGILLDGSNSIAIDQQSNLYITGNFANTIDFDPGPATAMLTSLGGYNAFLEKLDSAGNFLWARQTAATTTGAVSNDIALDTADNVYAIGQFAGTADFDPGSGTFNLTCTGAENIFISKTDSAGNFIWAKNISGTGDDVGQSIAVDGNGYAYITGWFQSPSISCPPFTLNNPFSSLPSTDILVAKIDLSSVTGNNEYETFNKDFSLYPNPASDQFSIIFPGMTKQAEIFITDISGKLIYNGVITKTGRYEVNTGQFERGLYFVQIKTADFTGTRKILIAR